MEISRRFTQIGSDSGNKRSCPQAFVSRATIHLPSFAQISVELLDWIRKRAVGVRQEDMCHAFRVKHETRRDPDGGQLLGRFLGCLRKAWRNVIANVAERTYLSCTLPASFAVILVLRDDSRMNMARTPPTIPYQIRHPLPVISPIAPATARLTSSSLSVNSIEFHTATHGESEDRWEMVRLI